MNSSAKIRAQIPTIKKTTGKNPQWYIRPYVDILQSDGTIKRKKQRFYLGYVGEMNLNAAKVKMSAEMQIINRAGYVIQQQMPFSLLIDEYERSHVNRTDALADSTRGSYKQHLNKEIKPELGPIPVAKITNLFAEKWLSEHKASIRADLKKICRGVFAKAIKWGLFKGENPFANASIGRKKAVYQRQPLSIEDQRRFLQTLPPDMRLFCAICVFCTLRKSEVRGLQWRHIDWKRGIVMVRQRWYRGDIDQTKTEKSTRDVPLGYLLDELRKVYPGDGHSNDFIFDKRKDLHSPVVIAAKKLGLYWRGFGFHQLRREALTSLDPKIGIGQAARVGGQTNVNQTAHYIMPVPESHHQAIREHQQEVLKIKTYDPWRDDLDDSEREEAESIRRYVGQISGQLAENLEKLEEKAPSIAKNLKELVIASAPRSRARHHLEEVFRA